MQYDDTDRAVWEWFLEACSRNIPFSNRLIQERALVYAEQLGHSAFSGSNGWLEKWMTRHNVRLSCLSGEVADVDASVVDDWSRRLQSLCEGYELRDIFNANETGLFYRALPSRSMVAKGDEAKGSKKAKERITALLACSAVGEKLTPLVIGRSANPRCFRGVTACLPVTYAVNKKAWMTSDLFQSWLNTVNIKMKSENRSILLFVDNCSAHPHVVHNNVTLVFLPPNTTSRLQPCDAGIIQTVKMHYRKLLRSILARMNEATCASDLVKSVNILDAIMFLRRAWDAVQPSTITRCFEKCGFVELSVREEENETAGEEVNLEMDLQFLVHSAGTTWAEHSNCDQELATSYTEEDVDWEQRALERAVNKDKEIQNESDTYVEDDAEEEGDDTSECLSEREAAVHLHQLRDFAVAHDNAELLQLISKSQTIVEKLQRTSQMFNIQSRITVFFQVENLPHSISLDH